MIIKINISRNCNISKKNSIYSCIIDFFCKKFAHIKCNFEDTGTSVPPRNYVRRNLQTSNFSRKNSIYSSIIDFFRKKFAHLIYLL